MEAWACLERDGYLAKDADTSVAGCFARRGVRACNSTHNLGRAVLSEYQERLIIRIGNRVLGG